MADLKISALNSLAGADLVAADVVAVVDDSASETKKLTVSDLIANGSTLISDNTIPSAKILFSAGAIDTAELAASAVETAKINDSAVTAAKLADNSSVTLVSTLPASGDFTGQIALDTDDNKIYIWDGSAWDSVKGAGSINVVNGSTTGEINIVASTSGDTVTISATLDDTTAAAQFLGGPTGAGGAVGYRALVGTDLPTASTTAKGGVIVNGNGLTMSGDTIAIDNTVTAETTENHIVQYDANGLITSGRAIAAADVPVATSTTIGVVKPGSGLGVTGAGELNHDNSVTAGTAAKVTFDTEGHITGTESLVAADIPDLDADKVTSGAFPTARIASDAITADKLANYTVAQISETTPTADFTSQFFFNPITRDLFLWDGNVFQPVGISAGEIVLAGTYDASTNLLDSVTAEGSAAGFTNGQSLPAADTGNNRYYVVVTQTGTGSAPAPTVTLEPPDILLSNGTSYVLVETSETITAQIASNVGFTPTGNIAGTNVQAAVAEVDSEKLAKGGDTMTGDLTLNNVNVVFEGATENEYETTLTATDPTADNTLSLPDNSGSLVSTGDTGTVTSAMIADGTIVNADISASAEIAVSKLANGTARQLLQTDVAGTGVEFTSNIDVPGTLDVTGAATLDSTLGVTGLISADGKVKFPAGSASAPSFYSGTDTDTGLYFSAANEISVSTGGTQRVVVDSSGRLLVGLSSDAMGNQIQAANTGGNNFAAGRFAANTGGPDIVLRKSRNATVGSHTIVQNGDDLGNIFWGGSNGSAFKNAARITAQVDGTPGTGDDMPGRLVFSTTADGASSPSERLRIDSSGRVGIGTSSPGHKLDLIGTTTSAFRIRSSSGASRGFEFWNNSTTDEAYISNYYAGPIIFQTNNDEKVRIDSSGRLLVGTTSGNDSGSQSNLVIESNSSGASSYGGLMLRRGSTSISSGTSLGRIFFADQNGKLGARISGLGDGTWATNDYPGYLTFDTTADGASSPTERMRIDSSGNVLVGTTTASGKMTVKIDTNKNISFSGVQGEVGNVPAFVAHQDAGSLASIGMRGVDIRFATGSAERLRIDSSGRVGIGTTSPGRQLQINGDSDTQIRVVASAGGLAGIQLGDTADTVRCGIQVDASDNSLQFRGYNNSERMRIDSSGRLGVGTASPSTKLHVKPASDVTTDGIRVQRQADDGQFLLLNYFGGTGQVAAVDTAGTNPILRFTRSTDNSTYTESARIDSSGRVGIGNSSPSVDLEVGANNNDVSTIAIRYSTVPGYLNNSFDGSAGLTTLSNNKYSTADGSTSWSSSANAGYATSAVQLLSKTTGSLVTFSTASASNTNPTERMRIDSSGKLLIGTTNTNPAGQNTEGTAISNNGRISAQVSGDHHRLGRAQDGIIVSFHSAGGIEGSVSISGSTTSYNTSSDYRLKENVVDIADGITRVKQLQPRRFNFIAHASKTVDGFLAHEAQTVVPEAVTGTHNQVDDEGNAVMQGIDQSKLVPLLTAALQEAIAKIETLEAKVAALEAG